MQRPTLSNLTILLFYKDCFCQLPYSKGVDIVAFSNKYVLLLEIKNCLGHEGENEWRISPNNKALLRAPFADTSNRDSLDIEISLKAAMTIACLFGAFLKHRDTPKAEALVKFHASLLSESIVKHEKEFFVILFLEGDFACHTRSKKTIMKSLQDSIKKKLSWLGCSVSVIDSNDNNQKFFTLPKNKK